MGERLAVRRLDIGNDIIPSEDEKNRLTSGICLSFFATSSNLPLSAGSARKRILNVYPQILRVLI